MTYRGLIAYEAVIGSGADVPESQICDSVIWKTTAVCMHAIMH